jgi:hypothetical protein
MSNIDEQDERIAKILLDTIPLELDVEDIPEVSPESLERYFNYLKSNLKFPCSLTGIEDFPWEERFVFGYGSKAEHEKLKKEQPSYTDTFDLLNLDEEINEECGLYVDVKRISDNKIFNLPLADLKASDKHSINYQLLDDYSVWFVNNR